jgi:tetratricopeptide (TPR) repeat protein
MTQLTPLLCNAGPGNACSSAADALLSRGRLLCQARDWSGAVDDLSRALQCLESVERDTGRGADDGRKVALLMSRSQAWHGTGAIGSALADLETVLRLAAAGSTPVSVELIRQVHTNRGNLYQDQGRYAQAMAEFGLADDLGVDAAQTLAAASQPRSTQGISIDLGAESLRTRSVEERRRRLRAEERARTADGESAEMDSQLREVASELAQIRREELESREQPEPEPEPQPV